MTEFTKDTTKLKSIAASIPDTSNPFTNLSASKTRSALITNVNRPKVSTFIGKVSMSKNGLSRTVTIPRTKAATIAVPKSSTTIPGNK
jgi:hypothetical protein